MISEAVVAFPFSQPHPRPQLAEAKRAAPPPQFDCFIGVSAHLTELKEFISVQAMSLQPALLIGERGLRQEQIARALHQASDNVVDDYERSLIETALRQTAGNQTKAGRLLGLRVQTLDMKLKRFAELNKPITLSAQVD